MIKYDKEKIENIRLLKKAKQWYAYQLIDDTKMASVMKACKSDLFRPNIFIRICLFLLACFVVSAVMGLFSLMLLPMFDAITGEVFTIIFSLLFLIISAVALEFFTNILKLYGSGVDDALLYTAISCFISFIAFAFGDNLKEEDAFMLIAFLLVPVSFFAMMRYLDRIMTLTTIVSFYTFLFFAVMKIGPIAKYIMPFVFMIVSYIVLVVIRKNENFWENRYLNRSKFILQFVGLTVLYMSGNYFIIRETSIEQFGLVLEKGEDIPMAWFFYLFTVVVPIVYLYLGIKRKDKLYLWTGLLVLAATALTFKYYFSLGHPEIVLTLAGLLMILVAYLAIKKLKNGHVLLTDEADPNEDSYFKKHTEALAIAQSFGTQGALGNTADGVNMGGGEFGGAGSGGKY
ncbi:MAG: hypothetical protein AB7O73_10225 [Bacteroidia bacterium]